MTIKISCDVTNFANIDDLHEFQGELKSLSSVNYQKLKKSILEHGITMPFHVWEDEGKLNLLDGHQRRRTLLEMRKEGFEVPLVPVVRITAKDWKDAKHILLSMVSQYGKVEKQHLYEFMTHADIDLEDLADSFDIPMVSLDLGSFETEFFSGETTDVSEHERTLPGEGEKELDENIETEHECPSCGYKW